MRVDERAISINDLSLSASPWSEAMRYAEVMEGARIHFPALLEWQPVIDGAEMAVLHGDPAQDREYVVRFRTHHEILVPVHWHQHDEHVTVVSGPFSLSINDARRELVAGSYAVIPAGVQHSAWYGVGTVIQVSGMGPFESIYVDPASDLGDRIKKQG